MTESLIEQFHAKHYELLCKYDKTEKYIDIRLPAGTTLDDAKAIACIVREAGWKTMELYVSTRPNLVIYVSSFNKVPVVHEDKTESVQVS